METDTCTFGTCFPTSFPEQNSNTVEDISTKLATLIKQETLALPFNIKLIRLSIIVVLRWKQINAHLGHFCQHRFRSITRKRLKGSTNLATLIKQVAINNTQLKTVILAIFVVVGG